MHGQNNGPAFGYVHVKNDCEIKKIEYKFT